jgi:signal transduction histidine kinase
VFGSEPILGLVSSILVAVSLAALIILAAALRRARARARQKTRALEMLARVEAVLASSDSAQAVANALDLVIEFSHAATALVWTRPETMAPFTRYAQRGLFPESFVTAPAETENIARLYSLDPFPELRAKGFVELIRIPLRWDEQNIGVLEIGARHRGELQAFADEWYQAVARVFAITLAHEKALARTQKQLTDEKRLWDAGLEVTATEDYNQVLRTIVKRARELIHAEASALCLWNQDQKMWVVQGTSGADEAFELQVAQFERGDGVQVACPVVRFKYRQAHLDLPVRRNGHIVGCLCVASQGPREYSAEERALLMGIAAQAALAVERVRALETMGSRAATAERERLAREIHDTLAQILGFVNIKTGVVREWLAQDNVPQAQAELEELSLLSQELYQDTRELVLGLHGETNAERGITQMLASYIERFSRFCDLPVTFDASDWNVTLSPAVEVQLLRVAQEALSNVRKHARAKHAWVSLTRVQDDLHLEIRDDGRGFDPARPARSFGPRFGLQSMRERVESIHGTFMVHSTPGQGARIQVTIPLIYRGHNE